jgi:hypothetical protein
MSPIRATTDAKQQVLLPLPLATVPSNERLVKHGHETTGEGRFPGDFSPNNPSQESTSRILMLMTG